MSESSNNIYISGLCMSAPELSHTVYEENFYRFFIGVRRLSGAEDVIPVTVSESILAVRPVMVSFHYTIVGQIRSYNLHSENGSKLLISVFAKELYSDSSNDRSLDCNRCELTGFICKDVTYRTTPFAREISDVLIAVNRRYGKSDYLPCIAWGKNARKLSMLSVGDEIYLEGRLQSREYIKTLPDGSTENRIAYEVSCSTVDYAKEYNP